MDTERLKLVGVVGSPYSRKLRAVLRYRRIAHDWISKGAPETRGLPTPRVDLMPVLVVRDDGGTLQAKIDSTPLIRELDSAYPQRRVIPSDPALAFIDALLEDYADEWLTKAMFHYRWAFAADIEKAKCILPRWFMADQPDDVQNQAGEAFGARQIERRAVVGSSDVTAPTIEASYRRTLTLLAERLSEARFLFGGRPASADFGLYGQLTQLTAFDPTSAAIALETAPRVVAWVDLVDDLSGIEPDEDWIDSENLPATVLALLGEVGRVYAPFLLANAEALAEGAESVECMIDGRPWQQRPFPYQNRCLTDLRVAYAALDHAARARVDRALNGTGCEILFSA